MAERPSPDETVHHVSERQKRSKQRAPTSI